MKPGRLAGFVGKPDVDASTVECTYCHAKIGEACTRARSRTREGDEPEVSAHGFFHAERVRAAEEALRAQQQAANED